MSHTLLQKYDKLFDRLEKLNNDKDIESAHILEDKIYKKFTRDIINKRIKGNDVITLAKDINKYIVKQKSIRWYA